MSFDLNLLFNLHAEDNLYVNDKNTLDLKIFEYLKILKPNFRNEQDFPELWERGIE
jgi:hypothetical protein